MAQENEAKYKKSEILKRNIYLSAIDLFYEKGFENVKISDICEKLKISTGTFYYYFPSKEAVFLEYATVADELMEDLSLHTEASSCAERLRKLVQQKAHMFSVMGQKMSNVCLSAFLKHRDESSLDLKRSVYVHFRETIEQGIRDGEFRDDIDPVMLTSGIRYMLGGITLHWASSPEYFDVEKVLDEHLSLLIENMKKEK